MVRWAPGVALLVTGCSDPAVSSGGAGSTGEPQVGSSGVEPADTTDGLPPPSRDDPPPSPPPDMGSPVDPPPSPQFVDVTAAAGLEVDPGEFLIEPFCILDSIDGPPQPGDYCIPERFLGAAAVGDYDGDGWPDVLLTAIHEPVRLMRNQGDGTFEDVAESVGLSGGPHGGAAWLDVEGDGDLDLMLTSFGGTRNELHINDGAGHFEEQGLSRGTAVDTGLTHVGMGIGVGDYDLDGYLDVFVADWRSAHAFGVRVDHNRLLHNRGAVAPGRFEDVTEAMGIDLQRLSVQLGVTPGAWGFAPAFVDLDGDLWPELALAADFGTSRLWWNDGQGAFLDGTEAAGVGTDQNGMGSAFGDYDGDGDLDWFVSSIYAPSEVTDGNRMYRNEGDRSFTDVTDELGVRQGGWGWGTAMFDADHDGDLDLALAAGWPSMAYVDDPVRLWLNDGAGPWPDVAVERGIDFARQGRGLVPFDYDLDGDLDLLVIANTEPPALYRNDLSEGSWLVVRAVGQGGNTESLGARVRVQTEAGGPWQVRQIGVGSHFFGQSPALAHFGLPPGDEPVARVEILWPASGRQEILTHVPRNERLVVHE